MNNCWEEQHRWNISYRRNLKEEEFEDSLALMNLLAPVNPSHSRDRWIWNLDKNSTFCTKTLTMDLDNNGETTNSSLVNGIWTDFYPKKVKFFLWKLDTTASALMIKSRDDRHTLHYPLNAVNSASWTTKLLAISSFIVNLLNASGWKSPLPLAGQSPSHRTSKTSSPYVLTGHSFNRHKKIMLSHLILAFLWTMWTERNSLLKNVSLLYISQREKGFLK